MGAPRWAWLSAAEALVDAMWPFQRRDHRATVLTIVRAMAWAADPETMLTKPTLARLMAVTGRSERSVQRWLRRIEASPLVEVTEPGTTPQFRPGILHGGQRRNLAREWLLIIPAPGPANYSGVIRGHPWGSGFSGSGSDAVVLDRNPPTRARERPPRYLRRRRQREGQKPGQGQIDRRSAPGSSSRPSGVPTAPSWPLGRNPRRRPERLAAAEALRGPDPVLRRISARELRSILRPYFAAKWTPQDVLWHAAHERDGAPLTSEDEVRHPAGWLRSRLARWTGPDGTPLPPISQDIERRREREHERQELRRAEGQAAAARRSADPAAHADQVRARHGWERAAVRAVPRATA
jgi:hypothetical protein